MTDEELAICRELRAAQKEFNEAHERAPWTGSYKERTKKGDLRRREASVRASRAFAAFDKLIDWPNCCVDKRWGR